MDRRTIIFIAFSVALLTFLIYIPSLQNGFVNWDDEPYVLDNLYIRSFDASFFKWAFFDFHSANWHPFTWISHAFDYRLWGLNPFGHHLSSIILHGLNTLLVVLLIASLLESAGQNKGNYIKSGTVLSSNGKLLAVGITGLLFGIHPLHVESVAWVSERKDMLYSFFYLLSIMAYVRYSKKPSNEKPLPSVFLNRLYLLTLLLFSFSLMSKPMAVTLPAVLLILDYYPLRRFEIAGRWKLLLIEKTPFILLSLASGLITLKAQSSGNTIIAFESVTLPVRILVGFKALIAYLQQMLWPAGLIPFYRHPKYASLLSVEYLIPILLVTGITIYCIVIFRRQRSLPAIWSYYVLTLLPVLGIIQVGGQAMANRYTYMPSLGPFLLAGLCAGLFYEKIMRADKQQLFRKIAFFAVFSFIFFILVSSTIKQTLFWKNSITLWTHEIEVAPNSPEPYSSRGNAYRVAGDYDRALQDLTSAIRLDPISDANYYNDRGIVYVNLGRFAEALGDFELAILINPNNPVYYQNREKARIEFKRIWENK